MMESSTHHVNRINHLIPRQALGGARRSMGFMCGSKASGAVRSRQNEFQGT